MDVGLNNKNLFKEEELKDVVFLVEATPQERHNLWVDYCIDHYDYFGLDELFPEINIEKMSLFKNLINTTTQ